MGQDAETEEEKLRWFSAAEKHLASLHADQPENDSAAGMLVTVLTAMGRRKEAEELCRTIPSGERQLQFVLEGEAQKKQRRIVLTKDFFILLNDLIGYGTPEAWEAAERIIVDVLGAEGFYADRLTFIHIQRMKERLEQGRQEETVNELLTVRDLTARWAGAGGYDKATEKAPFLEPHVPAIYEEHLWESLWSLLQAPLLDPLREREDFQALLSEAKAHQPEQ